MLIQRKVKKALLFAPEEYWTLDPVLKEALTNGCGPSGFLGLLIPDTIYFLSITEPCKIHDYMYAVGEGIEGKECADRTFLNNMIRVIDENTKNKVLCQLRYQRAMKYYLAVKNFGGPFYWEGKNPASTMQEVAFA